MIGSSRYYDYDEEKSEIEIGWTFLGRGYWGGSYNKEVKKFNAGTCVYFRGYRFVLGWLGQYAIAKSCRKIGGVKRDGEFFRMHGDVRFDYVVFELRKENYSL